MVDAFRRDRRSPSPLDKPPCGAALREPSVRLIRRVTFVVFSPCCTRGAFVGAIASVHHNRRRAAKFRIAVTAGLPLERKWFGAAPPPTIPCAPGW